MIKIDVRAVRKQLGMSQPQFAARFGIHLETLRGWEQHKRTPTGAARVLLIVISRAPEVVLAALDEAPALVPHRVGL